MLKKLLFAGTFGLYTLGMSQITITWDEDLGTPYNGDTVVVSSTNTFITAHMDINNEGASPVTLKWQRVKLTTTLLGYSDELCDNQLCWNCTGTVWTRPSTYTIPAGGSTIFEPKITTDGTGGMAHFRYYILNSSDVAIDSVDVIYSTTVGIAEETELTYSIYPNPASTNVNIKVKTNGNQAQVRILNILGEEVSVTNLVDGMNTISVSELTNGIYFYSIIKNNAVVETKKLIVRH